MPPQLETKQNILIPHKCPGKTNFNTQCNRIVHVILGQLSTLSFILCTKTNKKSILKQEEYLSLQSTLEYQMHQFQFQSKINYHQDDCFDMNLSLKMYLSLGDMQYDLLPRSPPAKVSESRLVTRRCFSGFNCLGGGYLPPPSLFGDILSATREMILIFSPT